MVFITNNRCDCRHGIARAGGFLGVQTVTEGPTEADLESRINAALLKAFPWLPQSCLKHQTKFAFKFGHKTLTIDGANVSRSQARADILIFKDKTPLAVLELKRPGLELLPEDGEQGLSYARMLHPRPPLVVVSNGTDQVILETHSGAEWQPQTHSERALGKLMAAAGAIAASDLDHAVEVLLGPGSAVWVDAIRAVTETVLSDMAGDWDEFDRPFVEGFLIPRQATAAVLHEVRRPKRITILEGAALAGKSSVLREVAISQKDADDIAVLFVEADSHGDTGIVETITSILADELGWNVSTDDTRAWLVRMSHKAGHALVLAIDGIGTPRNAVRKDIEELSGNRFGSQLRMILGVDDTVTHRLTMNETGRKATNIGRRASQVKLGLLDHREFGLAVDLLLDLRIGLMNGAKSAAEYRVPWVLRSLVSEIVEDPKHADETLMAGLPPLMGPDLLHKARARFGEHHGIRQGYQALAEAILKDEEEGGRQVATALQSLEAFIVRRRTLLKFMSSGELEQLIEKGFAKHSINDDNESIVVARIPELLASEIALQLADELKERMHDPDEATTWLIGRCGRIALGDVIGVQALFDCAALGGSISLNFIEHMLNTKPRVDKLKPGMKLAMSHPDAGRINLTIQGNGKITVEIRGKREVVDFEEFDEGDLYADMESWLILAHLAGYPFILQSSDGSIIGRADQALLMEVGTAPMALRRPVQDIDMNSVQMHDMKGHGSIVCHAAGIIEPITFSLYKFLSSEQEEAEEWIDDAIERKSLPLLVRIDIALLAIMNRESTAAAHWAEAVRRTKVLTAIKEFPQLH
ncbi:hypothetical protein CN070_23535 [Sinorhizobium meliloti]|nr:hypothetical protein CN070_23535 [Sinorhizobium meliloti]